MDHQDFSKRRFTWTYRGIALTVLALVLWLHPVNNGLMRASILAIILILWCALIWRMWRTKWLRWVLLILPAVAGLIFAWPGRLVTSDKLRSAYVQSLRGFEGTRYVWGGENRLGVDCSGLLRAALINSCIRNSITTVNPALLRLGADVWWHDCSARALGEQYRQMTVWITNAPAINSLNFDQLLPGDMAVTEDGIHVLAYLGEREWIEADPDVKRVLIVSTPSTNDWFDVPVNLVRWSCLNSEAQPASE